MYQQNIPAATDQISISQGDLQGNFQEVNTAWNTNHVPFNLADEGKHWFLTLPNQVQTATFPPATSGIEIGLYALGGNLWFRPAGQVMGQIVPPGTPLSDLNLIGTNTNVGFSVSSGVKMTWWTIPQVTDAAWYNVPVGGGYPVFTTIYTVQVTTTRNLVNLTYPVCYGNTLGSGTLLDPWRIQLRTRNAANDAAAVILLIGS